MYLIQRELSELLYKQLMFISKKTEKVGRGKTAGQWGAGQEFIDEIFYWKIQLSKPETFPFPRMKHHWKKCNENSRAVFSGSWVNFHSGKNPKTQNSCKLLPRRGSWAPGDSGLQLVFSPSGKSWAVTYFRGQLCQFAPRRLLLVCSSLTQYLSAKALISHLPGCHLGHQTGLFHTSEILSLGQSSIWCLETA